MFQVRIFAMGATNYKEAMGNWKNSPGHYNNLKVPVIKVEQ